MASRANELSSLSSVVAPALLTVREGKTVVTPRTTGDVAAIARYAHENHLAIEIMGSGTKRAWGNQVDSDLLLDMTKLQGVREHVWQDLTATVAAGSTWSFVADALAQQSQRIALDPLWPEAATVGGIVATNDSGALRSRYGSLRDLIIGMTIVLADGTIARSGGKVVKNVAGYDLHKLMTGAFGTLGIIVEVTFRLHPSPKAFTTWTTHSDDVAPLERLRHRLADSSIPFEALQLRTSSDGFALDVALASLPGCLNDLSRALHQLATPLALTESDTAVWSLRQNTFQRDRAMAKLTASPDGVAPLTAEIRRLHGHAVAQQCGTITANLPAEPGLIASLREQAHAHGGSLMLLHWPGEMDSSRPAVWGSSPSSLALMQQIKQNFDSHRILNPGRFLEGI